MKNKTMNFLTVSIITIIIACIILFAALGIFMNKKSDKTLNDMGTIYMSGLNERISMHFETIIDMRFSSLQDVVEEVSDEIKNDYENKKTEIEYICAAHDFKYLALYDQVGNFDMLCGEPISFFDPEAFMKTMKNGEKKIAIGKTESGENIVIVSIPYYSYMLSNGENSLAIAAGFPVSEMERILALNEQSDIVFSHVIREDGSFVIKSVDAVRENYFYRIRMLFGETRTEQAEYHINELKNAMANHEELSSIFDLDEERRHIYCTSLPYSEWYLITVMPYGIMDKTVSNFSRLWISMAILSCTFILGMLIIVFVKYYRITGRQIEDLNNAKKAAESATKAKSEFLSNMSHDIRTPMNAIVGMTAIATSNIDNKEQIMNCLRKITLSSKHLLGLINDILDMSKIESGKLTLNMEQISLREIMESIVNIVQPQVKAKKQEFDVFINGIEAEEVYCDSVRFNQVLLNLLSNAIKFTPDGGKIELTLNEEASPVGENYTRVHIIVKDTGIGMSEEFRKVVFESFAREDSKRVHKTEGTGLGMAITKYIVDAMHGTIEVESEQGKGTTFYVTLDLEKAEEREEDMLLPSWNMLVVDDDEMLCESAVNSFLEGKHILLSEDNDLNWEIANELLSSQGLILDHAENGAVCVDMFNQSEIGYYDAILMDLRMPVMNGYEAADAIRALDRADANIPIIAMTADAFSEDKQKCIEHGMNDHVSKPIEVGDVMSVLKKYTAELRQS